METRPLGKNGPQVSIICFGAYPIGGNMGAVPESQAIATVQAAVDAGMTFIDTAEGYGTSESILGKALREMRRTTEDFTSALSLTEEPPPSGGASRAQQDTPQEPEGSQPRDGTTGTRE